MSNSHSVLGRADVNRTEVLRVIGWTLMDLSLHCRTNDLANKNCCALINCDAMFGRICVVEGLIASSKNCSTNRSIFDPKPVELQPSYRQCRRVLSSCSETDDTSTTSMDLLLSSTRHSYNGG